MFTLLCFYEAVAIKALLFKVLQNTLKNITVKLRSTGYYPEALSVWSTNDRIFILFTLVNYQIFITERPEKGKHEPGVMGFIY